MLSIFLLFIFLTSLTDALDAGKEVKIRRMDNVCEDNPDPPILFDFDGFGVEGKIFFINFTLTVKEDMPGPLSMKLRINRCKSKENPDTCESFISLNTRNFCKFLNSQSKLWRPFLNSYKPSLTCPLKKGVYRATNAPIDSTAFLLFPSEGWYWTIQSIIHDHRDKGLGCINIGVIITTRN